MPLVPTEVALQRPEADRCSAKTCTMVYYYVTHIPFRKLLYVTRCQIGDIARATIQSVKRACSLSGARFLHLLTLRSRLILKEKFNAHRELSSILFCEKKWPRCSLRTGLGCRTAQPLFRGRHLEPKKRTADGRL